MRFEVFAGLLTALAVIVSDQLSKYFVLNHFLGINSYVSFGEYFNIDPTVVRLLWIIFSLLGGCGVLAYIIAAIVIPEY